MGRGGGVVVNLFHKLLSADVFTMCAQLGRKKFIRYLRDAIQFSTSQGKLLSTVIKVRECCQAEIVNCKAIPLSTAVAAVQSL